MAMTLTNSTGVLKTLSSASTPSSSEFSYPSALSILPKPLFTREVAIASTAYSVYSTTKLPIEDSSSLQLRLTAMTKEQIQRIIKHGIAQPLKPQYGSGDEAEAALKSCSKSNNERGSGAAAEMCEENARKLRDLLA